MRTRFVPDDQSVPASVNHRGCRMNRVSVGRAIKFILGSTFGPQYGTVRWRAIHGGAAIQRLVAMRFLSTICLVLLGGCSAGGPSAESSIGQPSTAQTAPSTGPTSIFREADAAIANLVDANVAWRSPARLTVDETTDIGLAIGGGQTLRDEIEKNLPNTEEIPAGKVSVGPVVKASLIVDPADATVEPNDAIDASTSSDIALLWTWKLHPLHPDDELTVTALIAVSVPGTDYAVTHDIPLRIPVDRTFEYTVYQVFSNWATWAAIAGAAFAGVGWLWRHNRNSRLIRTAAPPGAI